MIDISNFGINLKKQIRPIRFTRFDIYLFFITLQCFISLIKCVLALVIVTLYLGSSSVVQATNTSLYNNCMLCNFF